MSNVTDIDDDAGQSFSRWLYGQLGKDRVASLSSVELAELAWRESARHYAANMIDMMKPLTDPKLRKLASLIAFETPEQKPTEIPGVFYKP